MIPGKGKPPCASPRSSPARNGARPPSTSPAYTPSSFLPFTGRKWRMSSAIRRCHRTVPWNWPPPGGHSISGLWKATSLPDAQDVTGTSYLRRRYAGELHRRLPDRAPSGKPGSPDSHFMIQPYRNCHVFAAVKGMTEDYFSSLVLPRYEHWIRQGRGMSFLLIIPAIMLWC